MNHVRDVLGVSLMEIGKALSDYVVPAISERSSVNSTINCDKIAHRTKDTGVFKMCLMTYKRR